MKRDLILIVLGLAGFVACARGSNVDGIDAFDDDPLDGVHANDGGAIGDGSTGDGGSSAGDSLPIGAISFFDGPCPTGWSPYATAVGRTVVPTNGDATLQTVGNALAPMANPLHGHTVSMQFDLPSYRQLFAVDGSYSATGNAQTVVAAGTTSNTSAFVPYVMMRSCQKVATPIAGTVPTGLTTFFEAASCPSGWAQLAVTSGRVLVGTPAGGATDAQFGGTALSGGAARTHTHRVQGSWTPTQSNVCGASGGAAGKNSFAQRQAYPYDVTSSAVDSTPPYLTLTHCRRT